MSIGGWRIALSQDGKTLYIANGLSNDVSLVDTGSDSEWGGSEQEKAWG